MWYLPTSIIMISISILIFTYTIKNRKDKMDKKLFTNEMLVGILFLLAGILFPFMYQSHSANIPQSTLNFLWISTSIILILECLVWTSILSKNAIKTKKHPEKVWDYDAFSEKFLANWEYDFKKDVERKLLHLLPVVVILGFWSMGVLLLNLGMLAQWGLNEYALAYWLIITVGYAFVVMFAFEDLARLTKPNLLPVWAQEWIEKSMKPDELNTFVSSSPLVLSFIPFVFAPFPIFAAVAVITAVADAAASLVGKKYGKRKFREADVKTVEGYLAGSGMTFLIVVIITGVYIEWMAVSLVIILFMAIVAGLIFFLVDAFFSKNITDNILNPLLTGIGMTIVLLLSIFII